MASPSASPARASTLLDGVAAVVAAMQGEAQLENEKETAFALLRRGCNHCRGLPADLDAVGPKATIVAFLARVATRRSSWRQIQELASILAQTEAWRRLLLAAPPPLREALADVVGERKASFVAELPAPAHEARVFLCERRSRRFLTVTVTESGGPEGTDAGSPQRGAPVDCDDPKRAGACAMTALAASLFVCCRRGGSDLGPGNLESMQGPSAAAAPLGFEHEGVPGFGKFLVCKKPWWRLTGGDLELCCAGKRFGPREEFLWGADATIQHATTGLWLYVDPAAPEKVAMHKLERSAWEALPAF